MTRSNQPGDYALAGVESMDRYMRERQASIEAAFLLPHLRPDMSLVDIGCGQGTITVGLGKLLSDGSVSGFDPQADHITHARGLAESNDIKADFRIGDVYAPPFPESSFDAAYANAVLCHLPNPDLAMTRIAELVRPGGVVAIRDRAGDTIAAGTGREAFMRAAMVRMAVMDAASQNPYGTQSIGLSFYPLCRAAGLEPVSLTATWQILRPSDLRAIGFTTALPEAIAERALKLGITSREDIDDFSPGFQSWMEDADAFYAIPWFEIVARKP